MALDIVRRIRGNIHGSIDVTPVEDEILSHRYFQRLRRIRQTAFLSLVFPGASHTRFEHSLGVMHMAGVAWRKIEENQKRLHSSTAKYADFAAKELKFAGEVHHGLLAPTFHHMEEIFSSDYTLQALRIAALTHDLGHPPFSHSGERFLPPIAKILEDQKGEMPDWLEEYLQDLRNEMINNGKNPHAEPVRHEVFTLLLLVRMLDEIYEDNSHLPIQVSARDIASILTPAISPEPHSELLKLEVNKLCNELVSGEVDIDRMDYLQRDSSECGVVYGQFDAHRILDSLTLYYDSTERAMHLAIQYSGLAAFEDYLRARQSMYLQLYFHKTSVAAEAMLQHISKKIPYWNLPSDPDGYGEIDEYSIGDKLVNVAEVLLKNQTERSAFKKVVNDLLFHRVLWKRVYELSGKKDSDNDSDDLAVAMKVIEDLGIPVEKVSSKSSLTKFRSRSSNSKSSNYLRLIKKDARQFPRVQPIEDHSEIMSHDSTVHIERLYIPNAEDAEGVSNYQKVSEKLLEAFKL